jgi:protein gp37
MSVRTRFLADGAHFATSQQNSAFSSSSSFLLRLDLRGISWVIVGGESGPGARPMDQQWVVDIRNQCLRSKVAFFFKQWGGKNSKSGGRLLEGKEWNEFPMEFPTCAA